MRPTGFFIDANLFVRLVVGSVGTEMIAKHRRLRGYSEEDYKTLVRLLDQAQPAFHTPQSFSLRT